MDRSVFAGLYGEARRYAVEGGFERTIDRFEARLRACGATHLLLCGLPLPRRSMAKLIVRIDWPDLRTGGHLIEVSPADALLSGCLAHNRPFVVLGGRTRFDGVDGAAPGEMLGSSELMEAAGGRDAVVVAIPIHDLSPWQGCVVLAGSELAIDPAALGEMSYFCGVAVRALIEQGRVDGGRPGELSDRERHVLRLTAIGKTAAEIADLLDISQRTVHAHLQNAGEKMNASNKTHTVTEALRYGQIRL